MPTSRVDEFGEVSKEVDFVPEGAVVDVTVSLADIGSVQKLLFSSRESTKNSLRLELSFQKFLVFVVFLR